METTVKWKLEDLKGKTKMYLEHSGISNYQGETAVNMFNSFDGGWDSRVVKLAEYLNVAVNAG